MSGSLRRFLIAAALFGAIGVACQSAGKRSAPEAGLSGPCTNDATQQAVRAVPIETRIFAPRDSTSVAYLVPDDEITCRIRKAMLSVDDLPTGWKASRIGSDSGGRVEPDTPGPCNVPYTYMSGGLQRYFESGTTDATGTVSPMTPGRRGTYLAEIVVAFDHDAASDVMSAVRRSCRFSPATPTEGGGTVTDESPSHFRLVSAPSAGDESILYTSDLIKDVSEYDGLIRHGDVLLQVTLVGDGATPDELEAIMKVADGKIAAQSDYLQPTANANVTPAPTLDPGSRQAILESALLTPDELPRGWIPGRGNSNYDIRNLRFCTSAPVLPVRQRGASASYRGPGPGANGAALGIAIMSFAPQDADAVMEQVVDGSAFPDGCSGSVRDINVTWSVKPLEAPGLGDSSVTWEAVARHTAASGPANTPLISDIQMDFEVIRRGNLIALIIEFRKALSIDAPPFFDNEVKSDLATFGVAVDSKLKAIEGTVPPG